MEKDGYLLERYNKIMSHRHFYVNQYSRLNLLKNLADLVDNDVTKIVRKTYLNSNLHFGS